MIITKSVLSLFIYECNVDVTDQPKKFGVRFAGQVVRSFYIARVTLVLATPSA